MRRRHLALSVITFALGLVTLVYRGPGRQFVRGSLGDVAAVAFIAFMLGALLPRLRLRLRLAITAVIAASLELAQLLPDRLIDSATLRLVLGTHFDPADFVWYGLGLAIAALASWRLPGRSH